MSNKQKQKERRKRYEKAKRIVDNNVPKRLQYIAKRALTAKSAGHIIKMSSKEA